MIRANKRHTLGALLGAGVAALFIWFHNDQAEASYYHHDGNVFGTYYNIRYEAKADLQDSIQASLTAFDNSLSMFNPHSILSAINNNVDTTTNVAFEAMWAEATLIHQWSGGAFDITVAPLVNYWGFGNKDRFAERAKTAALKEQRQNAIIDSLRAFVGFEKVQLVDHKVVKSDPRVQLDGGAVAKGQACDMIAEMLHRNGCENYLVDIGGEVVCKGVNQEGKPWRIGISKPNVNNEGAQEELQEILSVSNVAMATSGNYRNYYYTDGQRRSHTIDPRTGYPVQHSLLSATIVSTTCMRADALATSCMVLGAEEGLVLIERIEDTECYFIVAQNDSLTVITSPKWAEFVTK